MITYNYCPNCGSKMDPTLEPPKCGECGTNYWRNAKPTAAILPIKDGKVLLTKRARSPMKGCLDAIGGFMEADELPEAAAMREAKEETGLDVKITSLHGIYLDRYGENGDYTLNIHYLGEIIGGSMQAMDDAAELVWIDLDKLPTDEGFNNTRQSLSDLKRYFGSKNLPPAAGEK